MCKKLEKYDITNGGQIEKRKRYVKFEVVHNKKNMTFYSVFSSMINEMLQSI